MLAEWELASGVITQSPGGLVLICCAKQQQRQRKVDTWTQSHGSGLFFSHREKLGQPHWGPNMSQKKPITVIHLQQ